VEPALALALGVVAGIALAAAGFVLSSRRPAATGEPADLAPEPAETGVLEAVFAALAAGAIVLDADDNVLVANPAAAGMRVARRGRLSVPGLLHLVRAARSTGVEKEGDFELPRGTDVLAVHVRAARASERGEVLLVLEDMTDARRLDAVRRDFVANVSHELKTPVGALSLLAEAVLDATDDPVAVRRFAERMRHESQRLGRLVQELIDLSRLQGADPMPDAERVSVTSVVREAVDRARLAAEAKSISIVIGETVGLHLWGDSRQLVTALANLLDNAVAYSPEGTRVAIGARDTGTEVEISVADQGIGIAAKDIERIFERFYRADPARSRATGGTGLGLAIVKHIAGNHGGSVSVWSVEGSGSTFTLHLPSPAADDMAAGGGEPVASAVGDAELLGAPTQRGNPVR
jgi:two-component system sensor histidine kinase SenX3